MGPHVLWVFPSKHLSEQYAPSPGQHAYSNSITFPMGPCGTSRPKDGLEKR